MESIPRKILPENINVSCDLLYILTNRKFLTFTGDTLLLKVKESKSFLVMNAAKTRLSEIQSTMNIFSTDETLDYRTLLSDSDRRQRAVMFRREQQTHRDSSDYRPAVP